MLFIFVLDFGDNFILEECRFFSKYIVKISTSANIPNTSSSVDLPVLSTGIQFKQKFIFEQNVCTKWTEKIQSDNWKYK